MRMFCAATLMSLLVPAMAVAQTGSMAAVQQSEEEKTADMQMDENHSMNMYPETFIEEIIHHGTSGTSAEPNSTPVPMLMTTKNNCMLMFHANVFVLDLQQSSERGHDKFFSTNWLMGMAQHKLGPRTFTARVMLSLEPATASRRRYPLLVQQGETAFGMPIVDGQHPHDFVMELAALYDVKLGEKTCCLFILRPWAILRWDRQRILIVRQPPKIQLPRSVIIKRTPRTSLTTL